MKKIVVVVLVLLLVFGTVNAAEAGDSPFRTGFKVSATYPLKPTGKEITTAPVGTSAIPDYLYTLKKAIYFNSKGECWVEGFTSRFDQWFIYMFNVDLKTGTVLKAVPIGYKGMLTAQSEDGRYLFISNYTLESNHYYIDSYRIACFDLENGRMLWNKSFFGRNYYPESLYPYKDSVIAVLKDIFSGHSRIARISAKGCIVKWTLDSDSHSTSRFIYNNKVYAMSPDDKGYLCEYDIDTGKMLRRSDTAMPEFGADKISEKKEIITAFRPAYFSFGEESLYGYIFSIKSNKDMGTYLGKLDLDTLTIKKKGFIFDALVPPDHPNVSSYYVGFPNYTLKNIFTVGKDYFLWMDLADKVKQQRIHAYKDGKEIWNKVFPLKSNGEDYSEVMPAVSGGYLYYVAPDSADKEAVELHRIEIATGKDEALCKLGKHLVTYVCGVDSTTVWVYAVDEGENKQNKGELIKVTKTESTLTVNANVPSGSYEISQDGKKETAQYGEPVKLPPGTYTVTPLPGAGISGIEPPEPVTVTLENGGSKVITVQYRDVAPPTITVSDIPEPKVIAGTAFFTITGTADDNFSGVKSVTVNGKDANYDKDKKSWSAVVTVPENETAEFDVIAVDNAGNKAEKTVTVDVTPPALTVATPVNFETVHEDTITVSGTAADSGSGIDTVTVNGNAVTVASDGSFSTSVSLTEGENVITVAAVDKAGNKTTKTIIVTYKPQIVITLQPDNPVMTVNGVKQEIDPGRGTTPVIIPKWGRTVVPIRAIVEALGGTIGWDGTERKVTINFNDTVIELWIDNPKAKVNGETKWIDESNHDVKPIIINSRTMLPLRFVAENLGCKVEWDAATRTITITYTP